MKKDYENLILFLEKRNVVLSEYLHYLHFSESSFIGLTSYCQKHQIDLQQYFTYLTQQENVSEPSEIQTSMTRMMGPYQLIEELGRGAAGVVYKAYHLNSGQIVALKVFTFRVAKDEIDHKRFLREIQIMKKLDHPGIVHILEAGNEGDQYYLAMELVHGKRLDSFLAERSLSIRERVFLIFKILNALQYAHEQHIIHRDLKLANILMTSWGEPKIADFGLAKELLSEESRSVKLTATGMILGTLHYMAPEQFLGESQKLDARTDLYAIGVCLYRLLTTRYPQESSQTHRLAQKIMEEDPRPPSRYNRDIHPDLEQIILKSLEKDPSSRYQTAQEFAADIAFFLEGIPTRRLAPPLKKEWKRFYKKYRTFFSLSLWILFVTSIFIFVGYFFEQQQHQQHSQDSYHLALREKKEADQISLKTVDARSQKLVHLFHALTYIQEARFLFPREQAFHEFQEQLGDTLVSFACEMEAYDLAEYIVSMIKNTPASDKFSFSRWSQKIQQTREYQLTQHLKKLNRWIQKIRTHPENSFLRQEALFEISRMQEEAVFLQLAQLVEEGSDYFLEVLASKSPVNPQKAEFYRFWVLVLGRMQKHRISPLLLDPLKKLTNKLVPVPVHQRPFAYISYMITIVEALGHLQTPGISIEIGKIRDKMSSVETLFWDRTRPVFRKLSRIDRLEQKEANTAEEYLERGFARFTQNRLEEALEDFSLSIQKNPQLSRSYFLRGCIRKEKKELERALADFSQAIRIHPQEINSYLERASVLEMLGNPALALQDYEKVIRLDPFISGAYNGRAILRLGQGNLSGAAEDCLQILKINPRHVQAHNNLGIIRFLQGKEQEAFQWFNQTLELNSQYFEAYYNRGLVWISQKKSEQAMEDFTIALQLNPRYFEAYNNRGGLKYQLGDDTGAIADFSEALRIKPQDLSARFNRGLAKYSQKDLNGAREDFQHYLFQSKTQNTPETKKANAWILEHFPDLFPNKD